MQQHDAVPGQRLDRLQHGIELQAARGRVVIRVGVDLEARAFEHRAVVVPGRVADPHLRIREIALEKVATDLEAAGATQSLQGGNAAALDGLVIGTEQQVLHGLTVVGGAGHGQIGLGADVGQHGAFGLTHGGHHGQAACFVEVDADAQVDLALTRVFLEILVEREDGVAWVGVDVLEHGCSWMVCPLSQSRMAHTGRDDRPRYSCIKLHRSA
jgi:hypothetical protein